MAEGKDARLAGSTPDIAAVTAWSKASSVLFVLGREPTVVSGRAKPPCTKNARHPPPTSSPRRPFAAPARASLRLHGQARLHPHGPRGERAGEKGQPAPAGNS